MFQGVTVCDAAVAALGAQDADLDLDHVEPARVLGRVMEFETAQNAVGVLGRKGVVERAGRMAGQVVEDDPDPVCIGIVNVDRSRMQWAKSMAVRRSVTFTLRQDRWAPTKTNR